MQNRFLAFVAFLFLAAQSFAQDPVGGVGIAFLPNEDGELVVKQIMPGSPADKAKLKPGGVLVAVDGRDVDELSPEQVRSLIAGKPGTIVKLTIETADEVSDVILQRAVLNPAGNAPRGNDVPANNRPANPQIPAPANQLQPAGEFPAWMKPGARVSWYVGSASIPGMSQTAVQDDNGNWIDPQTGQRYANADNPSSAGAGILQADILEASREFVAATVRNWLMVDVNGALSAGPITGWVGDGKALGEYWIHPAQLAAMPEQNQGGLLVRRRDYPLNGRNYNAVVVQNSAGGGFSRYTYDLETGLLLVASGRTVGAAQQQIQPNGNVFTGAGVTTITSTVLQDVRQLQLPFTDDAAPRFVQKGWQAQYRGGQRTSIQGVEENLVPTFSLSIDLTVERMGSRAAAVKYNTSLQLLNNPPQQSQIVRCTGAATIGGMWLNPASLQRLQPNAVIDEDRITKVRTVFQGVQNNVATILEQGPRDATAYYYDMQSGLLVGVSAEQTNGVGTTRTQVQLAGQR